SPKDTKNKEVQRRNVPVETSTSNALVLQCDGVGSYDWSFQAEEEPTNYALMEFTSSSSSSSDNEVASCSKACTKAYATLQSHYDKLTNDLRKSQFDVPSYKTGLESIEARILVYQQNETVFKEDIKLLKLDVMLRDIALVDLRKKFKKSEQERDDSESDVSMPTSPVYDRYKSGEGYHVVPPPYTETFMPPKPDLVFHDAPTVNDIVPTALNVEPSTTKPNKDLSQSNRPFAAIIEDWVSDSEGNSEGESMPTQKASSFVQTTEHVKTPRPSVKLVEHPIPAENLRKDIPKSRGHRHSRIRKACFVCKSLTYLIKDSVLTRSRLVPLNVTRLVNTDVPQTKVKHQRPTPHGVHKPHLPLRRPINRRLSSSASNFQQKVTTAKTPQIQVSYGLGPQKRLTFLFDVQGNLQHALKDKGVIDSGCSRHMTENMSYLSDFEEINGGYVAFGGNPNGGKITSKGKIRTGKLDFNDVYFVKELKFNLLSVSQMCDKKNSVLFTDTECIVLSSDFKLPDENHVLLRVPREKNMYNVDLKNIVPSGDLTCLFAKATLDESNLWHRRLGHINFKIMNKLVKGNIVRGLPSKVFKNNHTCVASKKSKQHRASCKTKPVSSVSQPLQRSDNETEFKNQDLNQFYGMKGIKREFSVARTPQQNRIAERKNMTLIKAARTMLADSLLLIQFWAEAVNTACYVQNRVLVTKPHNKTPYELLLGRTPSTGFMRPFGFIVTILNTLNPLGKFDGKADEGFLVGYSVSSKAFRVFNSRTIIVQETLHINFLENKPNVVGSGPTWLFDIDTLTKSLNYQPVLAGNQPNPSADPHNTDDDTTFEVKEHESEVYVSPSSSAKTKKHDDKTKREAKGKNHVELSTGIRNLSEEFKDFSDNSINEVNVASTPVPAVGKILTNSTNTFSVVCPSNTGISPTLGKSLYVDLSQYPDDPYIPALEDITYSDDEEVVGKADFSNLETNITEEGIDYEEVFALVTRIEAIRLFLAYASFMGFMVYQMDVKSAFLYGTIKEEVYVCQPLGFKDLDYLDKVYKVVKALYGLHQAPRAWYETLANYLLENDFQRGKIDQTLFIKKQKGDILLVQDYVDDIIFASTNKDLCKTFEKLMKDNFQMSSMGELTFFLGLQVKQKQDGIFINQDKYVAETLRKFGLIDEKSASTPIDTEKPFIRILMVRMWMYIPTVTPKASHLHAVKKIFSDYAGASLDRKSTTGGYQFLGCRLISWQCKKQTVVATSSTEAEYVDVTSYCAQVLWIQN
nr:hypothetical protein [Tanacetum cinerariifolium]